MTAQELIDQLQRYDAPDAIVKIGSFKRGMSDAQYSTLHRVGMTEPPVWAVYIVGAPT